MAKRQARAAVMRIAPFTPDRRCRKANSNMQIVTYISIDQQGHSVAG